MGKEEAVTSMKTDRFPQRGFSLLELLMVLAVVAILGAIGMMSLSSGSQAIDVTTGADLFRDALAEGRAEAMAQNSTVEVRLYARTPATGGGAIYDAMQLHWIRDGSTPPVAHVVTLPSGTALDTTAAHSTLIASNPQTATPDANDRLLNAQTKVFHFLANGSTDLSTNSQWFMTVRAANASDPAHFPANWACVSISALIGTVQVYRP